MISINFSVTSFQSVPSLLFQNCSLNELVLFSFPNYLLLDIYALEYRSDVLPFLNENIESKIVQVKNKHDIVTRIVKKATSFFTKYRKTSGRRKKELLESTTKCYALLDEVDTHAALEKQYKAEREKVLSLQTRLLEKIEKEKQLR